MTAASDVIVDVSGLHKAFGELEVLKGIDVEVKRGQVICIIGPSGSGKSTLLRCVNLLEEPNAGKIVVNGSEITHEDVDIDAARRGIGMVFQSFNLFAHLSVLDNLTVAQRKVLKRGKEEAERVARDNLQKVGLSEKESSMPAQLSGGQQQRVAIARALAMKPKIVLYDEPTSALDPEMIREVLDVMAELSADGMTSVVVTHEMGFARKAADRIVFMESGHIIENATSETFFGGVVNERTQRFLDQILH